VLAWAHHIAETVTGPSGKDSMGGSSHKTTRDREGQQIYLPPGDGLKTVLTEKAVSQELRVYLEKIIGFIWDQSAEPPTACPISIPPDKHPIPVKRRTLRLSEANLFVHPMAELLANIVVTTPALKPRGLSKGDKPDVAPSIGLATRDLILPTEYFAEELLGEDIKDRPLRCLELIANKYLYVDSVRRLAALQAHGYRNIPFLVTKYPQNGSWDQAILRSLRRAFESLREDPFFLRPEVRRRLLNVMVRVGLAPLVFKGSTLSTIYEVMQVSGSTTRAGRSKPIAANQPCTTA
jgi:hypothetical protein